METASPEIGPNRRITLPAIDHQSPVSLEPWTVCGSQVYNEVGAERAWAELLALYKQNLA
jgi:hypothetical protein